MQIWPFKPQEEFSEVLEWRTDIFRAKAAEQRIALRTAPRRVFHFSPILTDTHYSAARAMLRESETFLVPDWTQRVRCGSVSPGTSVPLSIDLTGIDLEDADRAILWESLDNYEQVTVIIDSNTDSNATVDIDEVVNTYTNPYLMPLVAAKAPEGLRGNRIPGGLSSVSVTFEVYENDDLGNSDYTQYRGHDVVETPPVISSGTFSESVIWPVDTLDNAVSTPSHIRSRTTPDVGFQMRWHETDASVIWELRRWIHSRRGRQKAFWLSSYGSDLTLAATIGASDTSIAVEKIVGMNDLGRTSFDIAIVSGGVTYYRRVTGVTLNTTDTLDLDIDSSLGVEVSSARISYLRCSRFAADRIEFLHRAKAGVVVHVPCIEIPLP